MIHDYSPENGTQKCGAVPNSRSTDTNAHAEPCKLWCIADILEDDFGCEGVPDDAEVQVKLLLEQDNGQRMLFSMPDQLALEQNLRVGDRIYFKDADTVQKL